MAKVFLDVNIFIDAVHRKPEKEILSQLEHHISCISTLTVHIYCYMFKIKIPNQAIDDQIKLFQLEPLSDSLLEKALLGPTPDLEDNIQLHSAVEADCDFFLTNDKKLLSLKFFGKVKVVSSLT